MGTDDEDDTMKIISFQEKLDRKRLAEKVAQAAEKLGGHVDRNGNVVLTPEVALTLLELMTVLETKMENKP